VSEPVPQPGPPRPASEPTASHSRAPMRPASPILDVVVRAEFHVLLVVSVYLLFAGHNQPGGGFAGGLVAGAACAARYVAGGPVELRRAVRLSPSSFLGLGLAVSVSTAFLSLVNDGGFLQHRLLSVDLPVIGPVKTSSAFFFDLGVYMVVIGTVLAILFALGDPSDDEL
jgi:multisubunit Na+/H+ antiporter MnhB subunit